jgi:tetratricopeptide (TPR) repeat protein
MEPANVPLKNATARAEANFQIMMTTEREDFFRRGGRAFYDQGLYKEAKNSWEQVLALKPEDQEALEGKARSEEGILVAEGKGRDSHVHDLLEQGLEAYANQNWKKALDTFEELSQVDPDFATAQEYIVKLNQKLTAVSYAPSSGGSGQSWRPAQASNQNEETVDVPDKLENFVQSRHELESQLKRDPTNIRVQQELDKVVKQQQEESDRVYKDGLIAYSQGNRQMAIQYWKQVLVIDPEHKKASAALNKARAEEERTEPPSGADQ